MMTCRRFGEGHGCVWCENMRPGHVQHGHLQRRSHVHRSSGISCLHPDPDCPDPHGRHALALHPRHAHRLACRCGAGLCLLGSGTPASCGSVHRRHHHGCGRADHRVRRAADLLHHAVQRRHGNHPGRHEEDQPRQTSADHHHRLHVRRLHRRCRRFRYACRSGRAPAAGPGLPAPVRCRYLSGLQQCARDLWRRGHPRAAGLQIHRDLCHAGHELL